MVTNWPVAWGPLGIGATNPAGFVLGILVPPAWVHELPGLRHPMRPIEGVDEPLADTSWHKREPEFEHLLELGEIDDQEHAAAIERLDSVWPTDPRRYQSLYRETPERFTPRRVVDPGDSPA